MWFEASVIYGHQLFMDNDISVKKKNLSVCCQTHLSSDNANPA